MEVKCLQKNLDRLSKALDPKVIATSLYEKEIINQSAWDEARKDGPLYDRNLNLLATLMSSIQAQPSFLLTFCEILEKEVVTAKLGAELRACLADLESLEPHSHGHDGVERNGDMPSAKKQKGNEDVPSISSTKKQASGAGGELKRGTASDEQFLLKVSWEVGDKWEELGVALGLKHQVLKSEVESKYRHAGDHMKAFYMLQEWKKRCGFKATYAILAESLEKTGLGACAQEYCYITHEQ